VAGVVNRALYPRCVAGSSAQLVALVERAPVDATPAAPVALPPVELPQARRPGWPTLASLGIAAGLAAIGLGGWAIVSGADRGTAGGLDAPQLDRALAVLGSPSAERLPLRGSVGRIVLFAAPNGAALLALDGLGAAPDGRAYEAWVVPPGSATPLPAGTFDGSHRIVPLTRRVPAGALVAVTLETEGGAERPSRPLRLVAQRRG
jgi:hypothetical protein